MEQIKKGDVVMDRYGGKRVVVSAGTQYVHVREVGKDYGGHKIYTHLFKDHFKPYDPVLSDKLNDIYSKIHTIKEKAKMQTEMDCAQHYADARALFNA